MTYRQRYRLTRTMLAVLTLAYLAEVWPRGNEPASVPATSGVYSPAPTSGAPVAVMYEDGSIVHGDGTTSCVPGAMCDDDGPGSGSRP